MFYTIAIKIYKFLPFIIILAGFFATLRKWKGRNDKKGLLDIWLVVKKHWLIFAHLGALYLALLLVCSFAVNQKTMPAFSMKFNYEEAAKGLFPDKTRFNASTLLNADVLSAALSTGSFGIDADTLEDCLQVTSTYDETAVDEVNPKVATEYQISFSDDILSYTVDSDRLIDAIALESKNDFLLKYSENTSAVFPDLSGLSDLDYAEIKDRLSMEASKLKRFMSSYQTKAQTFRTDSGLTFQSLSKKLDDYTNVGLEEYGAFVRENGITKHAKDFANTTDYTNKLLKVNYDKKMASYQTRIDAIHKYDGKMASVVMVPTDDKSGEFYMSRTKIGVDYFAEEANSAINDASKLRTQMDNNEYTKEHVKEGKASKEDYEHADSMVEELSKELETLSSECIAAFSDYQKTGREELVGIHVYHPELSAMLSLKKNLLFVITLELMLVIFYLYEPRRKNGKQ